MIGGTGRLILYVDDERSNRIVFEQAFQRKFSVRTVASGDDAIEVLKTEPVAVLVTDQRMPGMTGNELLERAKESHPDVVRIVITAYSDLDPILSAVNAGLVARYIIKPWDRAELEQILKWAVEAHALGKQSNELQLRLMENERLATIGTIAAAVLHEVRNPSTMIDNNLDRLNALSQAMPALDQLVTKHGAEISKLHRGLLGDLAEELPEIVGDMKDGSRIIMYLTKNLRRFLESDSAADDEVRACDPIPAIQFVVRGCGKLAAELKGKIGYDGPPALPIVRISSIELTQVLINLVTNAAHALIERDRPGGHVLIGAEDEGDRIRFVVRDDGPGIAEDVLKKIGKPFFTTRKEGTGLGLSQCRRIVEKHGGKLTIESTVGAGTIVTFNLMKTP